MSAPPVYAAEGYTRSTATLLPAYRPREHASPSRGSVEHAFALNDKRSKVRGVLKVTSSAPTTEGLPVVLEGTNLTGSFAVTIPPGERITRVSVVVRGEISAIGLLPRRFLDLAVPLWESSSASGPLSGTCQWPFSVSIPGEVTLSDPERRKAPITYSLPQTFLERGASVSAHYFVKAKVVSKGLLRDVDAEVKTMFVWVPAIRPDPPSPLRQLAYSENFPFPGPDADPEGWYPCGSVSIQGTVFNARSAQIKCVLSLAKPLSYTRGGVLPCFLTIRSTDVQALDLLANPSAINVHLQRQVTCTSFYPSNGGNAACAANNKQDCARAVWWPLARENGRPDIRAFAGEMILPKTLKPTSEMANFSLQYFIIMSPPQVIGFAPLNSQPRPLLRQEVTIATIFPRGPKPRSFAPH